MKLSIRPVDRKVHRQAVAKWHSHHGPSLGEKLALGAFVLEDLVAVIVMGLPIAPALQDGRTWEVVRHAVGPDAPRYTASRLLGAAGRVMDAAGIDRQVSYTRVDEKGTCYKAAGWRPIEIVPPREHTGTKDGGNRATFLPGIWTPSTEAIARVRWERGDRAAAAKPIAWDAAASRWCALDLAEAA